VLKEKKTKRPRSSNTGTLVRAALPTGTARSPAAQDGQRSQSWGPPLAQLRNCPRPLAYQTVSQLFG